MATLAQYDTWISEAETRRHELAMGLSSYSVAQRTVANRQISELDQYLGKLRKERQSIAALEEGGSAQSTRLFVVDNSDQGEEVNGRFS